MKARHTPLTDAEIKDGITAILGERPFWTPAKNVLQTITEKLNTDFGRTGGDFGLFVDSTARRVVPQLTNPQREAAAKVVTHILVARQDRRRGKPRFDSNRTIRPSLSNSFGK